jgi:hypothetical protein
MNAVTSPPSYVTDVRPGSLRPDIDVTRKAIGRLVGSLSGDPEEQATIAAKAAFEFIALDHGADAAVSTFAALASNPTLAKVTLP